MVQRFNNKNYAYTDSSSGEVKNDGFDFSKLMGGGEPQLANISGTQNNLSSIQSSLNTGLKVDQLPNQGALPSTVTDPLLDQLIKHFSPNSDQADGELGQMLKEQGY